MHLYSEEPLDNLIGRKANDIKQMIESETEDYILNVGEEQYVEHIISLFTIEMPEIHFDQVYLETSEREIPGSKFPFEFDIRNPSDTFLKDVFTFNIPYSGTIELLRFRPSAWSTMGGIKVQVNKSSQCISLDFINFYNNPDEIRKEYDNAVRRVNSSYPNLKKDIEKYNSSLNPYIRKLIADRKRRISNKSRMIDGIGIPLKQTENTPKTFAVPQPKLRTKIQVKPVVHSKGYKPEPTLDDDNYLKILKIINDVGKNFERLPSTYSNKHEEDLRDHILMTLDPNFEYGSASGETFNKKGKTDIQLRHDSSVVFVAECKFWKGEKEFLSTIDQLLGYLTWRNSKTSVVIFVENKGFTEVLQKVKVKIKDHPNYIGEKPDSDENWFNYIFSLPEDENKEIQLAVQLFHLPK